MRLLIEEARAGVVVEARHALASDDGLPCGVYSYLSRLADKGSSQELAERHGIGAAAARLPRPR